MYLKIIKTKKSSVRNCKFCLQDYKCCQLPCSIYQEAKRGTIGQLYIYYKNAKICERTQRALHVHKVFVNEVVKSISRILNLFPFQTLYFLFHYCLKLLWILLILSFFYLVFNFHLIMINENDTNIMLCSPNLADLRPLLMPNAINIEKCGQWTFQVH